MRNLADKPRSKVSTNRNGFLTLAVSLGEGVVCKSGGGWTVSVFLQNKVEKILELDYI